MNWLKRLMSKYGYIHKTQVKNIYLRDITAATYDRLTADWGTENYSVDALWRGKVGIARARSRTLCINNDYGRRFLNLIKTNVVGPQGITFQSKIKNPDGSYDQAANKKIENAWAEWSKKGNCDVTGRISGIDLQTIIMESVARDGEVLIRKVRGYDNKFGYALQLIEADHLSEERNEQLRNGNEIRMGVEYNKWGRPVAYHVFSKHPGDTTYSYGNRTIQRIPADEIIHIFIMERIGQSRGYPWLISAMFRLKMLGGYEEAHVTAARLGACKMAAIQSKTSEAFGGDSVTAKEQPQVDAEPGSLFNLPAGYEINPIDWGFPQGNYGDFMKTVLKGAASGLNVSYCSLANDLSEVNYSSIRQGALEERDYYRTIQRWLIETVLLPVFEEWLLFSLTSGAISLPTQNYTKFNAPRFNPRGWSWVDPLKEESANTEALSNNTTNHARILSEQGIDIEDLFAETQQVKKLAEKYGITLTTPEKKTPADKKKLEEDDNDKNT